jgi:radical SAM superfamily enzyme YgiQ (UPF0313 family)
MRILLAEPPCLSEPWEYSISSRENLALGYLAAILRAEGHAVELASCPALDWGVAELASWARSFKPHLVGVSLPFTDELEGALTSIRGFQEDVGWRVPIIAGGHAATASARQVLETVPQIAAVVRGEGEVTFLELVRALDRGNNLDSVAGLTVRMGDGIVSTPDRSLIANLEFLPYPARDILRHKRVANEMPEEIYLTGSRGCPYRCSFCDIKTFYKNGKGGSWRGRSPANIVGELKVLLGEFGSDAVYCFVDDQFIGPGHAGQERARAFAREIWQCGLELSFEITCRADTVNIDTFSLLKKAGLSGVYLGLDSGSQSALDRFQKDTTVDRNLEAVKLLRDLDIGVDFGFIMFDPWTTQQDIRDNLAFLQQIAELGVPIDPSVFINTLKFYPGTPIAERYVNPSEVGEGRAFQGSNADLQEDLRKRISSAMEQLSRDDPFTDRTMPLLSLFKSGGDLS